MLQLTTIFFLIASSILAVVHLISLEFYLYWRFLWLDVPVHVLGGAVVALGVLSLYDLRVPLPKRWRSFAPVVFFVIIIALLWEWYEIAIGIPVEVSHELDTAIDLLAGICGGVLGYIVGKAMQSF
jgi:hypothetical protein